MKMLSAAALMLGFATFASAQAPATTTPATTTTTTTTTSTAPKMEKKHRMSRKMSTTPATTGTATTGTATMPAATATTATKPATATTATKPAATGAMKRTEGQHPKKTVAEEQASAAKSAARDKVISKDAAGHDIHLGPNGGEYYINKEGTKTYLKAKAKIKVN